MKSKYETFTLLAKEGTKENIDFLMNQLNENSSFFMTRLIDFSLGQIETTDGIEHLKHYLFNGSRIQRNYAALTLNRIDEWKSVQKAYKAGLVDEIQTFAR